MTKNPQKILEGRYQVVPRAIIFIFKDGSVLLQKASETKKIFPGCYNGIGGHIERGESVLDGAVRELYEETGLACEDLQLAGTLMIDVQPQQGILLFVLTGTQTLGELKGSEEGSLHWIPTAELVSLKVVEDVPELVIRVLEFRDTGKLFFGKYHYDEDGNRHATWFTHP